MQFFKIAAINVFFLSNIHAATLQTRQSQTCVETCGSTCYRQSDIDAALTKGYSLLQDGQTEDNYPHQYEDHEGFNFPVSGPWYEYPILESFEVFDGGQPGTDRVIFNQDGQYADVITHTGAPSHDGFVECNYG